MEPGTAEALPIKFASRRWRTIKIRCRLSPTVTRFDKHTETRPEDDWVEVTAETKDNLTQWAALRDIATSRSKEYLNFLHSSAQILDSH